MPFNYGCSVVALNREEKIEFYTTLANHLTTANHAIWFDPDLSGAEQVE